MLPEKRKLEWKRNTSTPTRMAQIPNADNRKCWEGWEVQEFPFTAGRKGKWHSRFGGWSGSFFHNKTNLSTGSIVVLLGIYPNALNTYVHIKTCTQIFIAALFIIVKTWKQPQCSSVSKWINTLCYIQTIKQYLFLRHERILNAC